MPQGQLRHQRLQSETLLNIRGNRGKSHMPFKPGISGNPSGRSQRKSNWPDLSNLWTPEMAEEMRHEFGDELIKQLEDFSAQCEADNYPPGKASNKNMHALVDLAVAEHFCNQ
jgi:hypothetical protein